MSSDKRDISQNLQFESSSSEEENRIDYESDKEVIHLNREDDKYYSREAYNGSIRERKKTYENPEKRSKSKEAKQIQELEEKNKEMEERLEKSRSNDAKKIKDVEEKLKKNNSHNFCQILGMLVKVLAVVLAVIVFIAVVVAYLEKVDTVREEELDLALEMVEKEVDLAIKIEKRNGLQKNAESATTVVQDKLQTLLEKIKVNKDDKKEYEVMLKDQLVEYWREESRCKLMKGIQPDRYQNFLKRFEKSLGSTKDAKEIIDALEDIVDMKDVHNMVKVFNMEGTDVTGRYGMIAVHKNDNGEIDVAYAVYSVDAKFVGGAENKKNQYKIYHAEKVEGSGGLWRLGAPVVEDVATGEMVRTDQRFKQDDVSKLAHNFIVAKALMAFEQNGIISSVNYYSDQIEMEQTEKIENKSSN